MGRKLYGCTPVVPSSRQYRIWNVYTNGKHIPADFVVNLPVVGNAAKEIYNQLRGYVAKHLNLKRESKLNFDYEVVR